MAPQVEVLPASQRTAPGPGWAYIPSAAYTDPSKAPLDPSNPRGKRARGPTSAIAATANVSERQANALQRRLADLDRDSPRGVHIPIPGKKGVAAKAGKTTGTKKILISEKTFSHHLADEEAWRAQQVVTQRTAATPAVKDAKAGSARDRRAGGLKRVSTPATPVVQTDEDTVMEDAPSSGPPEESHAAATAPSKADEKLLWTTVPSAPTEEEIQALLAKLPLPYNAARSAPPGPKAPPARQFCEMCGYWGTIRCLKCGARVCGLECKKAHEGPGRCRGFFS